MVKAEKAVILLLMSFGLEFFTCSLPIRSPPDPQRIMGHAHIHFASLKKQDTFVSQLYSGADGHKVRVYVGRSDEPRRMLLMKY